MYTSTISLSLRFVAGNESESHYEFVDNSPYRHLTYSDKLSIADFEELVIGALDTALKQIEDHDQEGDAAKFLAINEFGFPFFRQDQKRRIFLDKLQSISDHRNAFILAGTSHCFSKKRNIAFLGQPRDQPVIEHAKFSPAINLGEQLKPKDDLVWKYYSTELGRIGILVCFDVIDPNVILRQIYFSRDVEPENKINLYVIPTFSANDFVRDQAELLSYFTKSAVLYTNCQYADPQDLSTMPTEDKPRLRSHGLFLAGQDVSHNIDALQHFPSDCAEALAHRTYRLHPEANSPWASIETHMLRYRVAIETMKSLRNDFSPLMSEILSLAKPDPSLRRE